MSSLPKYLATFSVFFLVSCGGGGGGSDSGVTPVASSGGSSGSSSTTQPSCTNPHSQAFPSSFMGDFEIPVPTDVFPEGYMKDIQLKDFGPEWVYGNYYRGGADWSYECTKEEYVQLMYRLTLEEIVKTGGNSVTIVNYGPWEDASDELWVMSDSQWHISRSTVEYIVKTARELGLKVGYIWQFWAVDKNGKELFKGPPYNVDMALLDRVSDTYDNFLLETATWAEDIGITSLLANFHAFGLNFCGLDCELGYPEIIELRDHYMLRLSNRIDAMRERFSGEIVVGAEWNDYRVLEKADRVVIPMGSLGLSEEEDAEFSVDLAREKVVNSFDNFYRNFYGYDGQKPLGSYYSTDTVVFSLNPLVQSTQFFNLRGWVEDGFCTSGEVSGQYYNKCMQLHVPIDFSRQAIWLEGVLEAMLVQSSLEFDGIWGGGYFWLTPSLVHDPYEIDIPSVRQGFPEISQSIRGKPAQNILRYWFTGEWEEYSPTFSD